MSSPAMLMERPELISPEEYLEFEQAQRYNIARVQIVPARVGGPDFGRIAIVTRDGTTVRKGGVFSSK